MSWRSRRARDRRRTCGVIATRPQSTNGIAEPRRAAVLALAAWRRYDFLTAPTSGAATVP